jgi:hypothetical protein
MQLAVRDIGGSGFAIILQHCPEALTHRLAPAAQLSVSVAT